MAGTLSAFISISVRTAAISSLFSGWIWRHLVLSVFLPCFHPQYKVRDPLVPPVLIALLMLGWKRALLVGGGLGLHADDGRLGDQPEANEKGTACNVSRRDHALACDLEPSPRPGRSIAGDAH